MNENTQLTAPIEAQLVAYAGKVGMAETAYGPLVEAFRPILVATRDALTKAEGVADSVKDATCLKEIKQARECRLDLRKVRSASENTRKAQKANALLFGQTVDGFHKIIEALIEPVETALDHAEKTAERAEKARLDAREQGRKAALAPYADASMFPLRDMGDPAFDSMLSSFKSAKEKADADAKAAETARLAKIETDRLEAIRIRDDNARLKKEADDLKAEQDRIQKIADNAAQKAKDDAAAAKKLADDKLAQERADAKAEQDRQKAIADKALADQEAKAKEQHARLKAKADTEAAEQRRIVKLGSDRTAELYRLLANDLAEGLKDLGLMDADEWANLASQAKASFIAKEQKREQDRIQQEKKDADAQKLRDDEIARVAAEAKKKKDADAAAKKAAAAPDKEKLCGLAAKLRALEMPNMATDAGKIGLTFVQHAIETAAQACVERAEKL